jgi:ubiquinone/menaquinone biosynthesis C-methylase UbiE
MKKGINDIKNFWEERVKSRIANPRATTNDYWFRILEIKEIKKALNKIKKKTNVLDIGCGDGFSTISICKKFPKCNFVGGDYSKNMIASANTLLKKEKIKIQNIKFKVLNLLELSSLNKKFDVVITDRCLINLPNKTLQKKAIRGIWQVLNKNGYYIMVENFIEGHEKINKIRKRIGLPKISINWYNFFLDEGFLNKNICSHFDIIDRKNISSLYYLITKAVYSKICQIDNREPDYDHPIYKIVTNLDELIGNYGPVNLLVLRKKENIKDPYDMTKIKNYWKYL